MLDHLLQEILRVSAQENKQRDVVSIELLESVWPWLVGKDMARRTRPVSWEDGTLHIDVSTYAWVQELSFHQQDLTTRIKKLFPWPLKQLRLSVSTHFTPLPIEDDMPIIKGRPLKAQRPVWHADALDEQEVEEDLSKLDDDLRDSLERIRQLASKS